MVSKNNSLAPQITLARGPVSAHSYFMSNTANKPNGTWGVFFEGTNDLCKEFKNKASAVREIRTYGGRLEFLPAVAVERKGQAGAAWA